MHDAVHLLKEMLAVILAAGSLLHASRGFGAHTKAAAPDKKAPLPYL
jgi:hypothetical protein